MCCIVETIQRGSHYKANLTSYPFEKSLILAVKSKCMAFFTPQTGRLNWIWICTEFSMNEQKFLRLRRQLNTAERYHFFFHPLLKQSLEDYLHTAVAWFKSVSPTKLDGPFIISFHFISFSSCWCS